MIHLRSRSYDLPDVWSVKDDDDDDDDDNDDDDDDDT